MEQSILKCVKKLLNVDPDDPSFDLDIITHINNAFSNLNDLGIGPDEGFVIEDDTTEWADFLDPAEDKVKLSKAKTVVYLSSRLAFDPPTSGFLKDALEKQLQEAQWRINANREATEWTDPDPVGDGDEVPTDPVLDGGDV